jgi:hypothetical protein
MEGREKRGRKKRKDPQAHKENERTRIQEVDSRRTSVAPLRKPSQGEASLVSVPSEVLPLSTWPSTPMFTLSTRTVGPCNTEGNIRVSVFAFALFRFSPPSQWRRRNSTSSCLTPAERAGCKTCRGCCARAPGLMMPTGCVICCAAPLHAFSAFPVPEACPGAWDAVVFSCLRGR